MNKKYIYIKLVDKGTDSQTLYCKGYETLDEAIATELKMKKNSETRITSTSLQDLGNAGYELVNVSPFKTKQKFGNSLDIENSYIFRKVVEDNE